MNCRFKIASLPLQLLLKWRHLLYDKGLIEIYEPPKPSIGIGNLNIGGTGKTPMTEYLADLLKDRLRVAIISRGYRRKTKGFILAGAGTGPGDIGDELHQIYRKFNGKILAAADADRRRAIEKLEAEFNPDVYIFDDIFQHRKIRPGLQILLTPFDRIFTEDCLFPAGRLRDLSQRAYAADMLVVTKTPANADPERKETLKWQLSRFGKPVFFMQTVYEKPRRGNRIFDWSYFKGKKFLVVTGIARPQYFTDELRKKNLTFVITNFPDHAEYNAKQAEIIRQKLIRENSDGIITTEKDYAKLKQAGFDPFYVPIRLKPEEELFNQKILTYVDSKKPL